MIVVPDIQFNMVIRVSCLILKDLNFMSENQAVFRLVPFFTNMSMGVLLCGALL